MASAPTVRGIDLDPQTRCAHYHSALDVIAIRMHCCREYFACKDCHDALTTHALTPWPRTGFQEPAILCGVCQSELTIAEYLACNNHCPRCQAAFNPGCRNHYRYYFDVP